MNFVPPSAVRLPASFTRSGQTSRTVRSRKAQRQHAIVRRLRGADARGRRTHVGAGHLRLRIAAARARALPVRDVRRALVRPVYGGRDRRLLLRQLLCDADRGRGRTGRLPLQALHGVPVVHARLVAGARRRVRVQVRVRELPVGVGLDRTRRRGADRPAQCVFRICFNSNANSRFCLFEDIVAIF
jgi:hypothetical protein